MHSSPRFNSSILSPVFFATTLATCLCLLASCPAGAQPGEHQTLVPEASYAELYQALRVAEGHRNELNRLRAMKYAKQGDMASAVEFFTTAARYADKYSQHRLSLAHWHGQGTPVDRVQAYIWADLAAERGHREFLLIRERMWMDLNEEQRAQVLDRGSEFYAQYGDDVAKPRQIGWMLAFSRKTTGSHTGFFTGNMTVTGAPTWGSLGSEKGAGTAGNNYAVTFTAQDFYGEHRVDRHQYWVLQDAVLDWAAQGRVEIGELSETQGD